MSDEVALFTWCGKPNTELSREELLEIIQIQQEERESARNELSRRTDFLFSLLKTKNAKSHGSKRMKSSNRIPKLSV